ncbi:hook-length control protein FliK [Devosia sp. YR412]|uniref:flagellar hook-length control protein FliK n=1 Tax=Devosia sp. YR412 TaxID=1881030 RepID=UPI0008BB292D|nr:flagellar hook-length control protein FliK [Devosia sp. YR412]SEQ11433.1 hook-length control protein FliK [Devosia sp. YR412]
MASHLTVTTSTAGVSSTKSFGNSTADAGSEDVFAALLGASGAEKPEPTPAAAAPAKPATNDDVNMSTGFTPDEDETIDPVAAAIDAQIAIVPAETAQPKLTELVEGLADLKAKLAAGEPIDPKALKELDALLTSLAQQLNIDLTDLPSTDELAALMAAPTAGDESLTGKLVQAFGPMVSELLGQTDASASAELSAQMKAVGDKLAALLTTLNQGETDGDALAALQANFNTDTELKTALDNALKPTIAADAAPALATPALKLPDSSLTSKTEAAAPALEVKAEKPETADPSLEVKPTVKDGDKPVEASAEKKSGDDKPADTKPTAVAATADKQPDAQVATQTIPTARVDAVAALRVVQVGYQTSQQQLNLPQLAFEMARQVGDGNSRFQIRLDPAELGKIDVRLDIDASGQVNARLTVEKAETLDLMQRDQKALERALQQAGLDSSKTNLEFSLKDNPFSGGQQGKNANGGSLFGTDLAEVDDAPLPTVNLYRGNLSASGVNIIA